MKELKLGEILLAINGKTAQKEDISINKIFIDSRNLLSADLNTTSPLFFALKGNNFDGNDFVSEVIQNGAKMAVVEHRPKNLKDSNQLIFVRDTLQALRDLASYYKGFFNQPVVGITGSVGKTISKEFTANVLSEKFSIHKTKGNLNSIVGLPLTIFELHDFHDISVLELGSDHFGEIKKLTQICQPSLAVITNVGESHLEFLHNLKGVFQEKFDIFMFSRNDCLKIFNGNIKFLKEYKGRKNFVSYGLDNQNDFVISDIVLEMERFSFKLNEEKYFIFNNVRHNIFNAVPAIIIGKHFGLTSVQIQKGLTKKPEVKLRMQILKNMSKNWTIIADCYNANPQSMRSALDYLKAFSKPHKFVVLGDMLELGEQSISFHKEIGKYLEKIELDKIISIGNLSQNFNSDFHFKSAADFLNGESRINFPEESVILIKGSRNLELERIVERLVQ